MPKKKNNNLIEKVIRTYIGKYPEEREDEDHTTESYH